MCVCKKERERVGDRDINTENVCVRVCVWVRERDEEKEREYVCERKKENVCERERERKRMCV